MAKRYIVWKTGLLPMQRGSQQQGKMPVGKCNYCIECMRCQESGTKAQYWGESARTGYKRGKEHVQALRKGDEESPLVKHAIINHQGEIPDF